jgi:hypothetical protein
LGNTWNPLDHQFHNLINLYIYDNKIWAATTDGLYFNQLQPSVVEPVNVPDKFILEQNYPNPFNPSTKISWQSSTDGHQSLKVYDVLGNEVATLVDEFKEAGNYEINFDASSLSSGVYFYRIAINWDKLQSGSFVETKKMILTK